jgi:hypothetical protein
MEGVNLSLDNDTNSNGIDLPDEILGIHGVYLGIQTIAMCT